MALGVVVVLVAIGIVVGLNTSSNNEEKTLKMVHIVSRKMCMITTIFFVCFFFLEDFETW